MINLFMNVFSLTVIPQHLMLHLEHSTFDIDPLCIFNQSYDGASFRSGKCTGVQTRVREFAPNAMYMHSHAHDLNLVLLDSFKSINL